VTRAAFLSIYLAVAAPAGAAAADLPSVPEPAQRTDSCKAGDPTEVLVCGRSPQRYRIDPAVLAATRAAEAKPPKPPITGDVAEAGCVGPNCGGGSYVPLIGMALTALKAVELAAEGDDWREAFRTRPDEYQAYKSAKAKKGRISIGVSAGNK
jgi:hypothetical protein